MNTHVPGLWSFFRFFASFCLCQISQHQVLTSWDIDFEFTKWSMVVRMKLTFLSIFSFKCSIDAFVRGKISLKQ